MQDSVTLVIVKANISYSTYIGLSMSFFFHFQYIHLILSYIYTIQLENSNKPPIWTTHPIALICLVSKTGLCMQFLALCTQNQMGNSSQQPTITKHIHFPLLLFPSNYLQFLFQKKSIHAFNLLLFLQIQQENLNNLPTCSTVSPCLTL